MMAIQVRLIFKSNDKEQKGFDFWRKYRELSSRAKKMPSVFTQQKVHQMVS